jgi:hypothetical protein
MNRRTIAIACFALFALAEIGDLIGLIVTLSNPETAAALLGITPRAEIIRAIILLALAVLVAINGVLAMVGALIRSAILFQFGALMTGVALLLYGAYQVGSAVLQHGQLLYAGVGAVYAALGLLAFWFARNALAVAARAKP